MLATASVLTNSDTSELSDRVLQPISKSELPYIVAAAVFGVILGLSSPGLNQWYFAWFGLVPLLLLTASAPTYYHAAWRAFVFGTSYNFVNLSWYLAIRPAYSEGFIVPALLICGAVWFLMAGLQGFYIGFFACILKAIPTTAGWLAVKKDGKWLMPSFLIVPLLWVLITNKLGNASDLMGNPWSMLEYSQYNQLAAIQCASIIGGIGVCACIVLANTTIAAILGFNRAGMEGLTFTDKKSMVANCLVTVVLLGGLLFYGASVLSATKATTSPRITVSALQAALNQHFMKVNDRDIGLKYIMMASKCPRGICVFPEWSFYSNFTKNANDLKNGGKIAKLLKQSWIVGLFDTDKKDRKYNSVAAFDSRGIVNPQVYHKQYLVPFGEYCPDFVRFSPAFHLAKLLHKTPKDTTPGAQTVVFNLNEATVTPIICFENIMPAMVASGVRKGANLIADSSNTSWFYPSILGDQMVAFSVMRAVENHRSFVFATTFGPSVIIDSTGKVLARTDCDKAATIVAEVPLENDITPFTRWCF
jgi:apolipoprotein N-acyltransferase